MTCFRDIIAAFGTPVVAQILGVPESHVRTMKARDSIPAEYWGPLIEQAPGRGVGRLDWAELREMRARRFRHESGGAAA